jgi:hypothetical protein
MYEQEGLALTAIESYYKIGKPEKAHALSNKLIDTYKVKLESFSKLGKGQIMNQFENLKPVVEFYQFVMNESEKKDTVFYNELRRGYEESFKLLEDAMD